MKSVKNNIAILLIIFVCGASLTSCGTSAKIQDQSKEIAGYTLKSKKELMKQNIAKKKNRTVLATP